MRIRINVDFVLSPRVKRTLQVGLPALILLVGSIAWAGVPTIFKDGDPLSAQTMNENFSSLDQRLAKLETLSNKQTADGGFSLGAQYCGATGNTNASLSALAASGTGYAKARAQCTTTCSSPSAHMCTGEELTRTAALGTKPPSGWYTAGSHVGGGYDCFGWTSNSATYSGPAWSGGAGNPAPSQNTCDTSYPVLCCD